MMMKPSFLWNQTFSQTSVDFAYIWRKRKMWNFRIILYIKIRNNSNCRLFLKEIHKTHNYALKGKLSDNTFNKIRYMNLLHFQEELLIWIKQILLKWRVKTATLCSQLTICYWNLRDVTYSILYTSSLGLSLFRQVKHSLYGK